MLDFLALLIVGDSVLTLLNPRRHLLLWDFGPKPCQRMIDSLVLVRGASRGALSQHYPVPLSMYRFGRPGSVPLRWRGPYSLPVGTERTGVLICWEQLLLAPMLRLAIESPRTDRLVAVSNLYFARGTPVAHIQRASVAAWARLFGVPYVHALNE